MTRACRPVLLVLVVSKFMLARGKIEGKAGKDGLHVVSEWQLLFQSPNSIIIIIIVITIIIIILTNLINLFVAACVKLTLTSHYDTAPPTRRCSRRTLEHDSNNKVQRLS